MALAYSRGLREVPLTPASIFEAFSVGELDWTYNLASGNTHSKTLPQFRGMSVVLKGHTGPV
jgi:hypothetical protein